MEETDGLADQDRVLFVDTFEAWTPLYTWIRQSLIPRLPASCMIVLSRSDFDDAIKDAFKAHVRPEAMHGNPLLRSRLIAEEVGLDTPTDERVEALRERLDAAAYSLDRDPKTAKYYRAVRATYLNPQPTQERAAEHLGLAFSTYRRYLTRGIEHVADILWRDEIGETRE